MTAALYRVQFRRAGWQPTTSTGTRIFAREADAWRFAGRVHAAGGVAIVATATRAPWVVAEARS